MRKIRLRRAEEQPAAPPPPPTPPPPRTARELVGGRGGLAAAVWGLSRRKLRELQATKFESDTVRRKLRELKGRRWERASEQARVREAEKRARAEVSKEAQRRAHAELARRIEKETGHRYSERTLRKHIRAGDAPPTVDVERMERQAAIDNAGSIDRFARSQGMSHGAVVWWRDHGGDLPEQLPDSLLIYAVFVATLISGGNRYKDDGIWQVDMTVTGEYVAAVLAAARSGDYQGLLGYMAAAGAEQFPWVGEADRSFEVTEILEISISQ